MCRRVGVVIERRFCLEAWSQLSHQRHWVPELRVSLSLSGELWLFVVCSEQCFREPVLQWCLGWIDGWGKAWKLADHSGPAPLLGDLGKWSKPQVAHHCSWAVASVVTLANPLSFHIHAVEVLTLSWDLRGSNVRPLPSAQIVVHPSLQVAFPGLDSPFESKHQLLCLSPTPSLGQLWVNSSLDLTSLISIGRVFFGSNLETQRSTEFYPRGNKSLNKVLCVLSREARMFFKKFIWLSGLCLLLELLGVGRQVWEQQLESSFCLVQGKNWKLQGQSWSGEEGTQWGGVEVAWDGTQGGYKLPEGWVG